MILNLYALRDSRSGLYFSPATGYEDKNIITYYRNMAVSMFRESNAIEASNKAIVKEKLLDSQIFKLGCINIETGELINDNNFLSNLITLEDLIEENKENEI